jgi:hypothetical protein
MAENNKSLLRRLLPRIIKATVKSIIVVIVFAVLLQFLAPLQQVFPEFRMLLEIYTVVSVVFIITGELTKGTMYHYVINIGRTFFLIGYTVLALQNGIITRTIQSVTFTANLQIFMLMIVIIEILNFAKNLMQIINYLSEKAETEEPYLVKYEQELTTK